MISGVTNFGIFVQLENMIEGLIPIESFNMDYYFDKDNEIYKVGNNTFKLGDEIIIKVVRASKENSEIDFEFVEWVDKSEKVKKKC